jgi:hypothetical protein
MDLEMKVAPTELEGFKPNELAVLHYENKHLVNCLREDGVTETIDWVDRAAQIKAADISVRCAICEEVTSMNSNDYRAQGVFICDKCKAAVRHIRKLLEDGGSVV